MFDCLTFVSEWVQVSVDCEASRFMVTVYNSGVVKDYNSHNLSLHARL